MQKKKWFCLEALNDCWMEIFGFILFGADPYFNMLKIGCVVKEWQMKVLISFGSTPFSTRNLINYIRIEWKVFVNRSAMFNSSNLRYVKRKF